MPQVAAKGKQHFKVYKEVHGSSTQTKIKEMTVDRINELEKTTGNIKVAKDAAALQGRKFFMTGKDAPKGELMSFRFKKRITGTGDDIKIKELKFYFMSGSGAYLPKKK